MKVKSLGKKIIYVILTGLLVTVCGGSLFSHSEIGEAASGDVKVTLHKLQFETAPTLEQNTGKIMDAATVWPGSNPLEGVSFEVYDMTAAYHNAYKTAFTGSNGPAAIKAAAAAVQGTTGVAPAGGTKVAGSTKTDVNGEAVFNSLPSTVGGKDAVYVFVEVGTPANPQVTAKSPNLVLALPLKDGINNLEDIHLYPKNVTTESGITIEKDRVNYDHGIGELVDYTIETSIPDNIEGTYTDGGVEKRIYTKYNIIDTHSSQLTFNDVTATYSLKTKGDGGVTASRTLVEGTDYNIVNKSTTGFEIQLTKQSIENLKKDDKALIFSYKMYLNGNSVMDTPYINSAKVVTDIHDEGTPELEVGTGGHRFIKEDSNTNKPIAGAEFVVRDADNDSAKYLKIDAVTKEISWVINSTDATNFVSDASGKFDVAGLKNGTYYLEETKGPSGYEKLETRISFVVTVGGETGKEISGSWTETTTVPSVIKNVREGFLPETGGQGFYSILIAGAISLAIGVLYFGKKRIASSK